MSLQQRRHRDETQFFKLNCAPFSNLFQLSVLSGELLTDQGRSENGEDA